MMYGIPLAFLYDSTGSLLDAYSGRRFTLSLIPWT